MVRPRSYDADTVAETAMQTFWTRGPHTSLHDLETATGLKRSSLYHAFGNREQIFRLCLERYMAFLHARLRRNFAGRTFDAALQGLLEDAVGSNFEGRGCFFFNCLGAAGELSAQGRAVLEQAYRNLQELLAEEVAAAQLRGEVDPRLPASDHATWLMATLAGLRAFNLSGVPQPALRQAAALAFAALRMPPAPPNEKASLDRK